MEKVIKIRSKEYPACTLNEAIEFVTSLKDYVMLSSISYEAAAKQIGASVTTKSFKFKISAARQFGLIATSSGKTLSFLDKAKAFAFPTETIDLIKLKLQCFSTPRLYGELLKLYKGKSIPKQQSLENVLTTSFGIAPNAKAVAAKIFIETANEIGAVQGGILKSDIQANSSEEQLKNEKQIDSNDLDVNEKEHTDHQNIGKFNSYYKFEIPTLGSKTASLLIPNDINIKDIYFISMFIQNMLPAFLENLKDEIQQTSE